MRPEKTLRDSEHEGIAGAFQFDRLDTYAWQARRDAIPNDVFEPQDLGFWVRDLDAWDSGWSTRLFGHAKDDVSAGRVGEGCYVGEKLALRLVSPAWKLRLVVDGFALLDGVVDQVIEVLPTDFTESLVERHWRGEHMTEPQRRELHEAMRRAWLEGIPSPGSPPRPR